MFVQKLKENTDELLPFYAHSASIISEIAFFTLNLFLFLSEDERKFDALNPFSFPSVSSVGDVMWLEAEYFLQPFLAVTLYKFKTKNSLF